MDRHSTTLHLDADGNMNPAQLHPDHDGPEAVHPEDHGPIYVPNDSHGPEVVKRDGEYYAPEAVKQDGEYQSVPRHDYDDDVNQEKGPHTAVVPVKSRRSRKWLWIGLAALLVVLAVGLGAGLGIGLNKKSSNDTATSSASSSTYTPVTSGTTGLAAFNCTSSTTTRSSNGTAYTTECYTQYLANMPSYTGNTTIVNLGGKNTVYTLEACLDLCDKFDDAGQDPCRAVTYYANLTVPIQKFGGNCFLKNDRGQGAVRQNPELDWAHTESAYRRCLDRNDGCKKDGD